MPGVIKNANTSKKSTRATSASQPSNPVTPVNRGTTPATKAPEPVPTPEPDPVPVSEQDCPVPKSPDAAIALLVSQSLLNSKKDPIVPGTIVNLVNTVAAVDCMPPILVAVLTAIALIIPRSLDASNYIINNIYEIKEKLEAVEASTLKTLELTESPPAPRENLGEKVDQMLNAVSKATASAEAAEKAAEESQKALTAFVDSQDIREQSGWNKVTAGNRRTHRDSAPDQGPVAGEGENNEKKKPARETKVVTGASKLSSQAIERIHIQSASILVQPNAGVLDSALEKLSARDLIKKADLAVESAWAKLENTDFAKARDLKTMPRIKFRTAKRLPHGGILYELENRHQAAFLSLARVAQAFEKGYGDVTCKGQRADLLLECAPISFQPQDPESVRALERENQLESGDIISCSWVKPEIRRSPQQTRAVLKVVLRSQNVADSLITSRGSVDYNPVTFRRIEEEPTRCLKCQLYGHRADKCRATRDVCSQCGEDHRSAACENRGKTYCASCKSEEHASWDRRCDAFKVAKDRFNARRPENRRKFFDPTREDTPARIDIAPDHSAPPTRPPPPHMTLDDIAPAGGDIKSGTIPAYFGHKHAAGSSTTAPERKERAESEPWDSESVITTPVKITNTPTSPPPLTRSVLDVSFSSLAIGAPTPSRNPFTLRKVAARSRASSVSSTSSLSSVDTALSMSCTPEPPSIKCRTLDIWQLNTNKSSEAQLALAHDPPVTSGAILAIQEPYLDLKGCTRYPPLWTTVYPSTHKRKGVERSRSFIAINPALSSNGWEQVVCECPDITAVRLTTSRGKVLLLNVYNPCNSNATLPFVDAILRDAAPGEHIVLLGDFNCHHPAWDEDRNSHLFTKANLEKAQELIDLTGTHGLEMSLPKDIPTLEATRTKNFTRPDNVFLSHSLAPDVTLCDIVPDRRPPCTDHLLIHTELNLEPILAHRVDRWNFKRLDRTVFRRALKQRLEDLDLDDTIDTQEIMDQRVEAIHEAVLAAIEKSTPRLRLCALSKRWWTRELTNLRKCTRKLGRKSYRARRRPADTIHARFRATRNIYTQAIRDAKRKHWEDFLESLDDETLWTAARYIGNEQGDGGRTRIPNLRYKGQGDREMLAKDNGTKSTVLLDAFFPPPASSEEGDSPRSPQPVQDLPEITAEDISAAILALKPHKAPGPDDIPACVYIAGADLLAPHLLAVYRASLEQAIYPTAWKHSRTAVLRKPGKPDYTVAKAYRPIALLNVVGKILSSCIAKRLVALAEKHKWIPDHHFGGRAGRTTTDALHILVKRIKDAWARGDVASALFLDVKGAFPHADPNRLAENMRTLGVPRVYIHWTLAKLEGRTTCLSFDDFVSDALPIQNGIDQGCPLSGIYYLFYNSPLVRVPDPSRNEMCVGYIDDITLLVWGKCTESNNKRLLSMMRRKRGALDWSRTHNSTFELDKTALIHFTRKKGVSRPELIIGDQTIQPVASHTLLGVILDQELRFKEQCNKALAKGLLWTSQLSRLARMSYGAPPRIARRLYLSIAVPRFTYAADVWFTPIIPSTVTGSKVAGSVGFAKKLAVIQSTAARAILGAPRSTPVAHLDAFASLLPVPYLLNEACQRAAIRLATVPDDHPLRKDVDKALTGRKLHVSPLQRILRYVKNLPMDLEQWSFKDSSRQPLFVPPGLFPDANATLTDVLTDHARVKAFSDGSRSKHGVGAAAIMRIYDCTKAHTGVRLGEMNSCSILEAELAGILLATQAISRLRYIEDAIIYCDSQLAIACVQGDAYGAPKALVTAITRAFKWIRERRDCTELTLKWCPAHRRVSGSLLADREAKLAARGERYPHDLIPRFLENYRPSLTRTVCKNLTQEANRDFALQNWRDGDAGRKLLSRFPGIQPEYFLSDTSRLNRSQTTLLFRLITGTAQLNRHLHTIKVVDSPLCTACREAQESVIHFILRCPKYAGIRRDVLASRGREYLKLAFLFSRPEAYPVLLEYVRRTRRFHDLLR